MVGVHFLHFLDICRVNSFIMYQQCYQKWNSGPMEEDPPRRLDQKEFSSSLVKPFVAPSQTEDPLGDHLLSLCFLFVHLTMR